MRKHLYTSEELLCGYDEKDDLSFVKTWDFRQFVEFSRAGGKTPILLKDALSQARRDAEISAALRTYIKDREPRMVGIMGGHETARGTPAFELIASIARRLASRGFLVVTGGGPGAMEAGHCGAYFANSSDKSFKIALAELGKSKPVKIKTPLVDYKTGKPFPNKITIIKKLHAWESTALRARAMADGIPAESLAVPTWLYEEEPTTVFATAYAKFFQDSIREQTLIENGRAGIIYARGGGGTLREIFQDVESNYYAKKPKDFTPMIFVDAHRYWQTSGKPNVGGKQGVEGIKVDDLLRQTFEYGSHIWDKCSSKVVFTTDFNVIVGLLNAQARHARANLKLMLTGKRPAVVRPGNS